MIKMRLKGRLGNQLFIYAFARKLNIKYQQPVLIYDRKSEKDSTWYSHLDNYKLSNSISFTSNNKEIMSMGLKSKVLFVKDRLRIRNMSQREKYNYQLNNMNHYIKNGLLLFENGAFILPKSIPCDLFCDGYFQAPAFFDDIRDTILEELQPRDLYNKDEQEFVNQIKKTNAVCLTIRLGDYIGNTTHQVCTKEYYYNAMRYMKKEIPDCVFYVFSDEIDKAKDIFEFEFPVIYNPLKTKDYMQLKIMSECKHYIISNSSFSWWAQYLGTSDDKIVLSPNRWYADDVPCDIFQKEWVLIDC